MSKVKKLSVILVCDTDPDRTRFGAKPLEGTSIPLSWRGVEEGIPDLLNRIEACFHHQAHVPKFTWCLRADEQMRLFYGSYEAFLTQHQPLLQRFKERDDELAWHHHYWRLHESSGEWYQECADKDWMKENFLKSFQALKACEEIKSLKTGWCYMDNDTMQWAKDVGLSAELSAMPYQYFCAPKNQQGLSYGSYDWAVTGDCPYSPSQNDYRVKDQSDSALESACGLREIPISVGRSPLLSWLEQGVMSLRRRRFPEFPIKSSPVSFKITFHPILFNLLWRDFERQIGLMEKPIFHAYFHPDELLRNIDFMTRSAYSIDHLIKNLQFIMKRAKKLDLQIEFQTAAEFREGCQ
ncbi:MAG: hypothetical protein HQL32_07980 [Planctomycetes bacterium]|nr:hypothetical protein [Planctomycetota bacterium]